jgi:hypothetical protein
MVHWQKNYPDLTLFWVANLRFIDNSEPTIFEAVQHNLKRGARYVYFVHAHDMFPGEEFDLLAHRLRIGVGDSIVAQQVIPVPINAEDLRLRFSDIDFDFVVANPHLVRDGASVAFQNVRGRGRVAFSVGMTGLDATINRLREYALMKGIDNAWKPLQPASSSKQAADKTADKNTKARLVRASK